MRITRRGRIVRAIAIGLAFLGLALFLSWATLPAECRGDLEKVSKFCQDLRK